MPKTCPFLNRCPTRKTLERIIKIEDTPSKCEFKLNYPKRTMIILDLNLCNPSNYPQIKTKNRYYSKCLQYKILNGLKNYKIPI